MVAPTRAPEARGTKCDKCQKILKKATWLDPKTKPTKVDEPREVLEIFCQHQKSKCPCIPKNIENLLIGSTHFQIHRIVAENLEDKIHDSIRKQLDSSLKVKSKQPASNIINDCQDSSNKTSKFRDYSDFYGKANYDHLSIMIRHLQKAIDYWNDAMIDQTSPFNSKLALRLGLTHHVIYACYLFKYHKLLEYQLKSSALLLNTFKLIEGVTPNARTHAYFLLIKTLIDCNQIDKAKQYLKNAIEKPNFQDKTHYESILLACVQCELNLIDDKDDDDYDLMDGLVSLAKVQENDKLQHYYARTLALLTIIRYIHRYRSRSDFCFEFYHVLRYIGAIIRRCYESSFDLVFRQQVSRTGSAKTSGVQLQQNNRTDEQISVHSWIRFAVCDFTFSGFEVLSDFFIRAGLPEQLETLYNGLSLVSQRTSCYTWRFRILSLGCELDLLCDKHEEVEKKIKSIKSITNASKPMEPIGYASLIELANIDHQIYELCLKLRGNRDQIRDSANQLINQQLINQRTYDRIDHQELYDCRTKCHHKLIVTHDQKQPGIANQMVRRLMLQACMLIIQSINREYTILDESFTKKVTKSGDDDMILLMKDRLNLIKKISASSYCEYTDHHKILEILLETANIHDTDRILLEAVKKSHLFIKSDTELNHNGNSKPEDINNMLKKLTISDPVTQIDFLLDDLMMIEKLDADGLENLRTEVLEFYLRKSSPNPDFQLYKKAHQSLFSFKLLDQSTTNLNLNNLLYHFCESQSANTFRYRWMLAEEQQLCPYVADDNLHESSSSLSKLKNSVKLLPFISNKPIRWPTPYFRLIQIKTILDSTTEKEHFMFVCFDYNEEQEPKFFHVVRNFVDICADDFGNQANKQHLTISEKFTDLINENKRTLMVKNAKLRDAQRVKLDSDLKSLLQYIDDELFISPLRSLICDTERHIGLILDQDLEHIPFESLPSLKQHRQDKMSTVFRVPSARIFRLLLDRTSIDTEHQVDADETVFLLDPAGDLPKTRERFDFKLKTQQQWIGCIGKIREIDTQIDNLELWLKKRQIYLFIGHGAGMAYYNRLANGRGLSAMSNIRSMAIVMGCSSGRVQSQGPRLETFGVNWMFIMRGAPAYLGLLWDVTDTDIDRFLDAYLSHWLPEHLRWEASNGMEIDKQYEKDGRTRRTMTTSEAIARARRVCKLEYLVGSTPVVYGLPMSCRAKR